MKNVLCILFVSLVAVIGFLFEPYSVGAQNSQSISVTPPLFQFSSEPGDIFKSSVRVVNNNPYPLTVYPDVVNFAPQGEGGQGQFIPALTTEEKISLAEWIQISKGPYIIPPEQSTDIEFFVEVPKDAAPGGHFAAILISTSDSDSEESMAILTSQTVTSLFFVRVEGDIRELADIREFSILSRSIEYPEAEFSLRFENKGNVHLQPRGDIIIYNMWGKERGVIPVNHKTHFGNVLPETIRDFRFTWKGEQSLADIGRYKALVTLAYGENGVKSVSSVAHFWVIPIRGALLTLLSIVLVVWGIVFMIRRYVRRMLMLAGVQPDFEEQIPRRSKETEAIVVKEITVPRIHMVSGPLRSGANDFIHRLQNVREGIDILVTIGTFILNYKVFFISLIISIAAFFGLIVYVGHVAEEERSYEVTIQEGDSSETLTDEDVEQSRQ